MTRGMRMVSGKALVIVAAASAACLSLPGAARERAPRREAADECFWPSGGPKETREAVQALVSEGNSLLNQSLFVPAATKYREALQQCNHPALHFNLALALMNLDQPVEMFGHLQAAIQWGPEPIEKERFTQAQNYATLLEKQLVHLRVRCEVPGAQVTLDGQPLLSPPGEFDGMVRPGFHSISASKEGLYTNEVRRTLVGGQAVALNLELKTEGELTEYRRRWAEWKPWALIAGGAVVGLTGGALTYFGIKRVADFDARVDACGKGGCEAGPERDQGVRMQQVAIGAYAVGGAALVTGVILAVLNREKLYMRPYDADGSLRSSPAVTVVPQLDTKAPGVSARVDF